MSKWLALTVVVAGAAMLQGCAYDPYSGTYVPSAGYSYGYPVYGYPTYGYPAYAPSYGGSLAVGGVWGGGYRGGDWDHRYHEGPEHREGGYRPEHPGGGHPVNLGTNYRPLHAEGGFRALPPGGHPAHGGDHDHDRDHH